MYALDSENYNHIYSEPHLNALSFLKTASLKSYNSKLNE